MDTKFEGCLTLVDVPSDKAPSGARGHRVVLTREAAEIALPSLLGMEVHYGSVWDGKTAQKKCGTITSAHLEGSKLLVSGFLFARDYLEMEAKVGGVAAEADSAMGMSYELADAHVADLRDAVWKITQATFTGAKILPRKEAAYRATSFRVIEQEGKMKEPQTLKPAWVYDTLRDIETELYMVTNHGPRVGDIYDQISAEHIHAAKMLLEVLIKAQKP